MAEYCNTVKLNENIKMVAHRGVSGLERENTIPAFVAACNRSYFGVECDVHVTRDGKYLIYHDDHTGRLCDRSYVLETTDSDVLRSLKLKEFGSEQFGETLKIPTLEEYLNVISRYKKVAVIELKNRMREQNISEIIEICRKRYRLDDIIFISADMDNLLFVRKRLSDQSLQFVCQKLEENLIETLKNNAIDLDIGSWLLTEETVKEFHENGIRVNCWTCNDAEEAQRLIDWGVDFITSNILE